VTIFLVCLACAGPVTGAFTGWLVYRGLVYRLIKHNEIIETAKRLESQRIRHDSARVEQVRPGAGPSAVIYPAMVSRTMRLTSNLPGNRKVEKKG
jgi:hypothetical protein